MWKFLKKAWDGFRHLKAFRDLLEALTLLKDVLLGASLVAGIATAVWSWVINLPGPVAVLIGLGVALLVMMLLSKAMQFLSELGQSSPANQDVAVPSNPPKSKPPKVALAIIAVVVLLGIVGFIASRYHHPVTSSTKTTAKQPAASPAPVNNPDTQPLPNSPLSAKTNKAKTKPK